jgi:uncharacterized protein (TIGR03437 family)
MGARVGGSTDVTVAAAGVAGNIAAVTHAASFATGPVAPGEVVTLFGSDLGPATLTGAALDANGKLSANVADTQVLFDGIPAPFVYASKTQTSVIVPYGISGQARTKIVVKRGGVASPPVTVGVTAVAPALFTAGGSGAGQAAVINQDNSINTPSPRGTVVALYATGEGATNPAGVDGAIAATTFPKPLATASVTIGGLPAALLYVGAAPGLTAGVLQVNVRVPANIPVGKVPVVLTVGGVSSRSDVTLDIR